MPRRGAYCKGENLFCFFFAQQFFERKKKCQKKAEKNIPMCRVISPFRAFRPSSHPPVTLSYPRWQSPSPSAKMRGGQRLQWGGRLRGKGGGGEFWRCPPHPITPPRGKVFTGMGLTPKTPGTLVRNENRFQNSSENHRQKTWPKMSKNCKVNCGPDSRANRGKIDHAGPRNAYFPGEIPKSSGKILCGLCGRENHESQIRSLATFFRA